MVYRFFTRLMNNISRKKRRRDHIKCGLFFFFFVPPFFPSFSRFIVFSFRALDYFLNLLIRIECATVLRAYSRTRWSSGNDTEGTAIIRGALEAAAAAATAAAALELIFKQRLKSANVVPALNRCCCELGPVAD